MVYENKRNPLDLGDDSYPVVQVFDIDPQPTHEQMTALFRKWKQDQQDMRWREFAMTALPTFHMGDAITVKWCGMWLAIETDGYCHS
jgi:hypothetical protein